MLQYEISVDDLVLMHQNRLNNIFERNNLSDNLDNQPFISKLVDSLLGNTYSRLADDAYREVIDASIHTNTGLYPNDFDTFYITLDTIAEKTHNPHTVIKAGINFLRYLRDVASEKREVSSRGIFTYGNTLAYACTGERIPHIRDPKFRI
ncbi:hypothetical protein JXC34_05185 [Candidatus Woesearchaeota archaeon]|nr:hypothetical protein [Candidatus Woesearchaeota archaeon]